MHFNLLISKKTNFFFFVSNLTEWHFSCRKKYNIEWVKILGDLNKQERNILKKFGKILNKHSFGERYIGNYFFNKYSLKKSLFDLKEVITDMELDTITRCFNIFHFKFNRLWDDYNRVIKKNKRIIKKELSIPRINQIISELSSFFNVKIDERQDIYLIINPLEHYFAGSANLKNGAIVLEVSCIEKNGTSDSERAVRTIFHEILHRVCKKDQVQNKIIEVADKSNKHLGKFTYLGRKSLMEESLICSLFPNGYLTEKFFHFKVDSNYKKFKDSQSKETASIKNDLCLKSAVCMYQTTKEYFDFKKILDKAYLNKIAKIIKG